MITFSEYYQQLNETEIQVVKGKQLNYNQVFILAGGGGSGKGYITKYLINFGQNGVKTINPDNVQEKLLDYTKSGRNIELKDKLEKQYTEMIENIKTYFLTGKLENIKNKKEFYKQVTKLENNKNKIIKEKDFAQSIEDINLKNQLDTGLIHMFIKIYDYEDKMIMPYINKIEKEQLKNIDNPYKQNLLFDVTLKSLDDLTEIVNDVVQLGYKRENIHIIWICNDMDIALLQNLKRSRSVPENILIKGHEQVAKTMSNILYHNAAKKCVNGAIYIVFANDSNGDIVSAKYYNKEEEKEKTSFFEKANFICVKKQNENIDTSKLDKVIKKEFSKYEGETYFNRIQQYTSTKKDNKIKHNFKKD